MERRFVTAGDGCAIAYRLDGPDGAPLLLLSNSLGTRLEMWAPQMEAFTRSFRVLRYDSRGHGASASPPGAYSMDRLGRDVIELADALGVERFDVCGLSKGGMVGQWLGVRAPDRVRRLVLANTAACMGPPSAWQARIDAVGADGVAPLAEASLARWFTPGFLAEAPPAVAAIRAMLLANDPQGYAGCCAAIRDMDQRPTARLIAAPVLAIAGAADPSTSVADAAFLADSVHDGRLVVLDAAHLSNVERPDAFAEAALDFLAA
jgi:3-oxoadipate enol-lactonase